MRWAMTEEGYILGDSPDEWRRLQEQSALWDPVAFALFDRIGIRPGWRVLELGPGPGSLHVELRRRVEGSIDAVEQSAVFAAKLLERTRGDGYGDGRLWRSVILAADLPDDTYDLIFARWVFCFLPDPVKHLKKVAAALRPGGLLAIEDYAHRESFALFPRPDGWLEFLEADRRFFASQGGDISVAGALPDLLPEAGLTLLAAEPTQISGRARSPVWCWLRDYVASVARQLSAVPPLDAERVGRLREEWRRLEIHPHAMAFSPTVMDLVAKKE